MKKLLIVAGVCICAALLAQQVVPPTTTPYVNLTTGLQISGSYGTSGSVLISTGSGSNWGVVSPGTAIPGLTSDGLTPGGILVAGGGAFTGAVTAASFATTSPVPISSGGTSAATAAAALANLSAVSLVTTSPQTLASALSVPKLNGSYYADQWCTTPGTLDDTCISNAVTDIVANGPISNGHRMGKIILPVGVYNWRTSTTTVTIPAGIDISIEGAYQTSLWGATLQASAANQTLLTILSDSVHISHISFANFLGGTVKTGVSGIQLGNSTTTVFDTHINWCWFNAMVNYAIHAVNTDGDDLSHNTFDANTSWGIYSNQPAGDIKARNLIATDLRSFQQAGVILMNAGSAPTNYTANFFSGLFTDTLGSSSAAVTLDNTINNSVSGSFYGNANNDISVSGTISTNIGPFSTAETGGDPIQGNGDIGLNIHDGTITDPGLTSSLSPVAAIYLSSPQSPNVANVTSTKLSGSTIFNPDGLYIASGTGTSLFGLNLTAQTGSGIVYTTADATSHFESPNLNQNFGFSTTGTNLNLSGKSGTGFNWVCSTITTGTPSAGGFACKSSNGPFFGMGDTGSFYSNGGYQIYNGSTNPVVIPSTATGSVGTGNVVLSSALPAKISASITPAAATVSTCTEQTGFTFTGLATSQNAFALTPPSTLGTHLWVPVNGLRISAANTLAITFCADATGGTPPSGSYTVMAF